MTSHFIEDFADRLVASRFVYAEKPIIGCTDQEIQEMEEKFAIKFPPIYRDYLRVLGRKSGDFLRGEEHSYPDLLDLKEDAQELLRESNSTFRLPPTAFIIWMSQGVQFSFFDCASGDDPPVFHYREGDPVPIKRHEHYSEVLEYWLEQQIEIRKRIAELDAANDSN
jgi:hypothetical protein